MTTNLPIIDATGLSCPLPLLRLKLWLKQAKSAEQALLLATDPSSQKDIPRFCEISQHQLLSSTIIEKENQPKIYQFKIKKGPIL